MKEFIQQLSNKFKSAYLIWIIFNFTLLMLGGGIFSTYNGGGIFRYYNDFFPFGSRFRLYNYDYTEFLVYTIVPIFIYYTRWLWLKK